MLVPLLRDLQVKETETSSLIDADFDHPLASSRNGSTMAANGGNADINGKEGAPANSELPNVFELTNCKPAIPLTKPSIARILSSSDPTPTSDSELPSHNEDKKPSQPPRYKYPEIGHFSTFPTDEPRPGKPIPSGHVTHEVFFDASKVGTKPPRCAVALTSLDLSTHRNIRIVARQDEDALQEDLTRIRVATWNNSVLYSGSCSWLEFGDSENGGGDGGKMQFGHYNIKDFGPAKKSNWRRITFDKEFSTPPKVVVFLSGIDMDRWHNWRIISYATDITGNGFNIHIDTWEDSILYGASATWIAYDAESLPKVFSGTATTDEFRDWKSPQKYNRGFAEFPEDMFEGTPRVFAGISGFDVGSGRNLRLEVGVEKVNRLGMMWKADSWADTIQHSATLSFIAME